MASKINHRQLPNKSFQWEIADFKLKEKEYLLKNKVTRRQRFVTKERLFEIFEEQEPKVHGLQYYFFPHSIDI
jgi:hypothetical protein